MKNQFNRQHRYNNGRSSRSIVSQQTTRFTILDSSGPLGKLRGTALQLAEKYQAGAKDAQTQGDVVLFQTCQQYADHYLRLQAIALENEQPKTTSEEQQNNESESAPETLAEEIKAETITSTTEPAQSKKTSKKASDDPLSMPIEALQEMSDLGEQ